jgi:SnoaL-like domain
VSAAAGRHPSDAERAEAARPVLEELVRAACAGDADAVAACLDEDVTWLDRAGAVRGRAATAARLLALAGEGAAWAPPVQHGAHAVLAWSGPAGPGGVAVEVRSGRVVLVTVPS